jgi:hypothetical protein
MDAEAVAPTSMALRSQDAIIVAAENTPGVKGIEDNLLWVDPTLHGLT